MDRLGISPRHPVLACVETVDAALKDVADVAPEFMSLPAKREALVRLAELEQRIAGVRLRVNAVSGDVAEVEACRSVAAWVTSHTPTDHGANLRDERLARSLRRNWTAVDAALVEGRVSVAQARVIVAALEDLPDGEVSADVLARAEDHLVEAAKTFAPKPLAVLGRRILEVVAPDAFEDYERRKLEDEERRAHQRTSLFTRRVGDGRTRISITVPDAAADRLRTYLDAFTSPRHENASGLAGLATGEKVPYYRKLGHAFCTMLEAMDPRRMPLHGGDATHVCVTMTLEELHKGLGAAGFGFEDRISAAQARRLACTAKIIPIVLGTRSEPLDIGRASRLFEPHQRQAMALRDKHCRAEGCTVPATWCEAHHFKQPWAQGGRTDIADGKLLCPWHHHRAHDDRYLHKELPNGDVRFHKRR